MFTVVVLWPIAVAWLVANGMFAQKPSPPKPGYPVQGMRPVRC